jgi:hypothetical protein
MMTTTDVFLLINFTEILAKDVAGLSDVFRSGTETMMSWHIRVRGLTRFCFINSVPPTEMGIRVIYQCASDRGDLPTALCISARNLRRSIRHDHLRPDCGARVRDI